MVIGAAAVPGVLADDDADVRDLVTFTLEQLGVEVVTAGDGVAALAAVRDRRPALAVLDVTRPGLAGLDVCRMIRADPVSRVQTLLGRARA